METKLEGLKIPYDVRESSEASNPRIDHKLGEFTVVIPEEQDLDPEGLLKDKSSWVRGKRKDFLSFQRKIPDRQLKEGGTINVLGKEKEIITERRRSNSIEDKVYLAEHLVDRTSVQDQLKKALKSEFRSILEEKIDKYIDEIDSDYKQIYVRDQQTRWGSCSSKQNLSFNWRLILGPEHVMEYVVVHELVHLEIKNHNEEFWSRVRELYPQYKKSNQWLSNESAELVFDKDNLAN